MAGLCALDMTSQLLHTSSMASQLEFVTAPAVIPSFTTYGSASVHRQQAPCRGWQLCLRPEVYLDLGFYGTTVPFARLDSKLLLTWAQHLTHIAVDDSFLTAPGAAAFLDRASKLVHISASCFTLVTAALADRLFSRRARYP